MTAAPPPGTISSADFLSLTFGFLSAANRLTVLAARGVKAVADLTLTEWRILTVLAVAPGTIASSVAKMVMVDKSVASRALRQLEIAGLISIKADPDNRRQNRLWLSADGEAFYRRALPKIRETEEQAWNVLSDGERLIFREIISKLTEAWAVGEDSINPPDGQPI